VIEDFCCEYDEVDEHSEAGRNDALGSRMPVIVQALGWIAAGCCVAGLGVYWLTERRKERLQLVHRSIHSLQVDVQHLNKRLAAVEAHPSVPRLEGLDLAVTELAAAFKRLHGRVSAERRYDAPKPDPLVSGDPAMLKNALRKRAGLIPAGVSNDETKEH
jgi:hypothetical protein